ncbi:MAG: hypothetical protein JNJ57_01520 [Saprospiraceae bacterium]|nr:hypothetical protein [Saprospiraceae bacterium]
MEDWQIDFEWLHVQNVVKDAMQRETLPDLNTVLFLIGIQELGRWQKNFTKEEKQDLMHIGVCSLLSQKGYFEFLGRDQDGWPHFKQVLELPAANTFEQEQLLKRCAIDYFKGWVDESKNDEKL